MSDVMLVVAVGLAGGIGAVLRYLVDNTVPAPWKRRYPWGTTVVNVSGAFAMGLLVGLTASDETWRTVAGVGLLGGYTTFSTASLETVRLLADRRGLAGLANAFVMLIACVLAAIAGLALVS